MKSVLKRLFFEKYPKVVRVIHFLLGVFCAFSAVFGCQSFHLFMLFITIYLCKHAVCIKDCCE